jgi:hypothetical protein
MIAADVRIDEIDPEHFANLVRLMDPPPGHDAAPEGSGAFSLLDRFTRARPPSAESEKPTKPSEVLHAPVVVLCRGQSVLRVVRLGGGTVTPRTLRSLAPTDLAAFRKAHQLSFVAVVDVSALPRLWADLQAAARFEDALALQVLALLRVLRAAIERGEIAFEPPLFSALPLPTPLLLQRTFDRLLPDGRSFVFYLVDRRRVWTSLIAVKRGGTIERVTTHRAIADAVRFESIPRDAPRVVAAVARRFVEPHIGLFLPLSSWHRLVWGDRSAIARAASTGQAVLDPCPPWLHALVGIGAMTEAASQSARLASRLLSRSGLLPAPAEKLIQSVTNPLEALGIDPWEAITWSRDWARRLRPLL